MMGRVLRDEDLRSAFEAPPGAPTGLAARVVDFVREAVEDPGQLPRLDVTATDDGISLVRFGTGRTRAASAPARRHACQAREELAQFFDGERSYFSVAIDLAGIRPFQRAVLDATAKIPLGEVRSYRWVAAGAGNRAAVRAAGSALRTNPVPLIVPCHRVVRTDGSLGGYAGGAALKRFLLRLESEIPDLVGRASSRRVCRLGCPASSGVAEAERVVFASIGEARAAGYRPCEGCRPA